MIAASAEAWHARRGFVLGEVQHRLETGTERGVYGSPGVQGRMDMYFAETGLKPGFIETPLLVDAAVDEVVQLLLVVLESEEHAVAWVKARIAAAQIEDAFGAIDG